MADSFVSITEGSGKNVDTRTNAGGDHRQVIVVGDPTTDSIAVVRAADPGSSDEGLVVRDVNTSAIVAKLSGTIGIYLESTAGTVAVKFNSEPTVISSGKHGTTTRPIIVNTDGAIKIYDIVTGTINAVTGITNSIAVHLLSTNGTIWIKPDPSGTFFTNSASTANIFAVSGSTSGVSASGVQLVAPSANASFKVFAFSLQTTGIVSVVARFTNGGGAATEYWRGLVTSNQTASAPVGANLAITPPGFLFATGTSTTLALHLDTATLVHYSVSYFKESA